jgi:putative oxidoreductase
MKPQPSRRSKSRAIAAWVLRVIVGLMFLLIAATKLIGTADTVEYFEAIGWGQWFRYLTGSLDLMGAVLLFVPRCTFYGAVVLISSVGTATVLSMTVLRGDPHWGDLAKVLQPLILTLLTVALAWLTWPLRPDLISARASSKNQ